MGAVARSPVSIRSGSVFPLPDDELARRWTTAVHQVAQAARLRVTGSRTEPSVARSFYAIALADEAGVRTLILNPAGRTVACVAGDHPFPANAIYIDVPARGVFVEAGFEVPQPRDLIEPLSDDYLGELSDDEAAQVRYHRPARVGDVLFNWFD